LVCAAAASSRKLASSHGGSGVLQLCLTLLESFLVSLHGYLPHGSDGGSGVLQLCLTLLESFLVSLHGYLPHGSEQYLRFMVKPSSTIEKLDPNYLHE
jgi:hypothetical protein